MLNLLPSFVSMRAVGIGALVAALVLGLMWFDGQRKDKAILELTVASQKDAINMLNGRAKRLDKLNAERIQREGDIVRAKNEYMELFESARNEIPTYAEWSAAPVHPDYHGLYLDARRKSRAARGL